MQWSRSISVIGAHAEGEIGRVVTGGVLDPPGATMREKLRWLNREGDHIRRFCLFEPRGAAQMTVNLLTSPCDPGADIGFIPMQGDESHAMSGSNAICVTTVLLETGMLEMREPETLVTLDTAAGLVEARARCAGGKVDAVALTLFPSFAERLDAALPVPGLGEIRIDVAFGGVFYVIVDAAQLGLGLAPENARDLVDLGNRIKAAATARIHVQHPTIEEFDRIEFCMFTGSNAAAEKIYDNATIMPPGRLDRSPCGTGTAARLAVMHARGEIGPGEEVTMRSAIGTRFLASIRGIGAIGDHPTVETSISGRAWIHAIHHLGVDPSDPFPLGFTVADLW